MVLLNYAAGFASLPTAEEQTAVALLFCNISSQPMGRSWLLYFSRWTMAGAAGKSGFMRHRQLFQFQIALMMPCTLRY